MTKHNKRKGFSAIEMLVVIAVIAVLVSIVIPMVGNQTIKSKAAANAANLRGVESSATLHLLNYPEKFDAFFENGEILQKSSEGIPGILYDIFFGEGEAEEHQARYNTLFPDAGNTQLGIPGSDLVISGLTEAKGLEAPGRNGSPDLVINDGVPMQIYITEEGAVVFYGNYTKEDFADVAADGYYDGTITGGSGDSDNGGLQDAVDEAICRKEAGSGLLLKGEGKHKPGADCKCPYCGGEAHYRADKTMNWTLAGNLITYNTSTKYHKCTCGYVFNTSCKLEGGVHDCVYLDCENTKCVDDDPNSNDKLDHKCYLCGERDIERWCKDDKNNSNPYNPWGTPDHLCDTCGGKVDDCVDKNTDYKCDVCNKVLPHNCVDNKNNEKDHACDICDASMGGSCGSSLVYDSDGHDCSYCGRRISKHSWKGNDANNQADAKHSCTVSDCTYKNIPCTFDDSNDRRCNVCEGGCVTPDTLITLADGSQKRVDELTGTEELLVWDHATGKFSTAPVAYIIDHEKVVKETEIISLIFSDGNVVKMISEHVFFDADAGKYVAITSENADSFVGHSFAAMSENSNSLHMAELIAVERTVEETEIYEVVTYRNLTCFTNNVLSASAYIDGLLNIFEIDTATMAYDAKAMQADLEKYGTIGYAFFAPFVSREIFDMYNGEYMSVAMGKGVLSLGDILDLIDLHHLYIGE